MLYLFIYLVICLFIYLFIIVYSCIYFKKKQNYAQYMSLLKSWLHISNRQNSDHKTVWELLRGNPTK